MKKVLFPILALVLALGLVLPVAAHTEGDPFVTNLIAGQYDDVGDVKVWNDDTNLYVQYVTTNWKMTETHLHVATSLDGIPQKNGNPPPGQFDYKMDHDPPVAEYTYIIPLSWDPCTELYIAAHAVAWSETKTMWVYSDETESFSAYGGSACADTSTRYGTAVAAWQHSLWESEVNPQFGYGTWVWESYRVINPVCGDVVDFEKTFAIPGYPTGGTLWITADNGYEAYLNDTLVGSDGLSGDWRSSDLTESYVTTAMAAWSSVENYSLTGLIEGDNTFDFATANEYFNTDDGHGAAGAVDSNPGGLIYEAEITYYEQEETAWGAGFDFPGKNWATYFNYHVQECVSGSVVNGDFEAPIVNQPTYKWDIFDSGTTGLGWTVEWYDGSTSYGGQTRPEPAHLELHRGVNNWSSYNGTQHAELDTDWDGPGGGLNNEPASVKIYQDIATCPGRTYTLSYAWSPRPGHGDNELDVYWNGSSIATHSGSGGSNTMWTEVIKTGLPSAGYSTRLEFIETGTPDSLGMFLDAVSVVEE